MNFWLRAATRIDSLTDRAGSLMMWCTLAMVGLGAFNSLARYASRFESLNLSSNVFIELQWYLFSIVFLLGGAYGLKHQVHVRVDVVYGSYSARAKAWIDLFGTVLFLLPFCLLMLWVTWPSVASSWSVWEQSPDPDGLPRYPIKTVVLLAFFLLILQAVSEIVKQVAILKDALPKEEGHITSASEVL